MQYCCTEPTLDEILGDFAVRLLMQSDGVEERAVRSLLGHVIFEQDRGPVEPN